MNSRILTRLSELGLKLPEATIPAFNYIPVVRTGNLLWVSGQVPKIAGSNNNFLYPGYVGSTVTETEAQQAAKLCILNGLSQIEKEIGSLDLITRIVKLGVFVASAPGFNGQPRVANGASDLLVEIFGESGKHARSAVGVSELPLGCSVEIEMVVQIAETN
eukprot:TRINITY_DN171_c1_g3_i1.p1 TRINITY_DN171_c1_g3~~TRINITY_DN171_c1_g3_i1.p1  ORF type:complete len:161 (+),score=87.50 TRINITY_DN171_c1_g3_i1:128-610(+)